MTQFGNIIQNMRRISDGISPNETDCPTALADRISKLVAHPPQDRKVDKSTKSIAVVCLQPGAVSHHGLMRKLPYLQSQGYGLMPGKSLIRNKEVPKTSFSKKMSATELQQKLLRSYPKVLEFKYCRARANQFSRLEVVTDQPSPSVFANLFGQSRMYLIPTKIDKEFVIPTPQVAVVSDVEQLSANNEPLAEIENELPAHDSPTTIFPASTGVLEYHLCKNGLHTVSSATATCLICEQDDEYNTCLENDKQLNIPSNVCEPPHDNIYPSRPTARRRVRLRLDSELTIPNAESDRDSSPALAVNRYPQKSQNITHNETLLDVLLILQEQLTHDARANICNVQRGHILDGGMRCFKKINFNATARLSVRFIGEDGIDSGGLRREFMSLALRKLARLQIFEGPEDHRLLALDATALTRKTYIVVGTMLAYFMVHGGPLPKFVHPFFFDMIVKGPDNVKPSLDEIYDTEIKDKLERVLAAKSDAEYHLVLEPLGEIISMAGCLSMTLTLSQREILLESLLHFIVVDRVRTALDQFCSGLACLGVLDAIRKSPTILKEAFVAGRMNLTMDSILDLYDVKYSPQGSNKYEQEQTHIIYWRDFVEEIEVLRRLSELLSWLTGIDQIPTLGFDVAPQITFGHISILELDDATATYPVADTCGIKLRLPIVPNYDIFRDRFLAALTAKTFSTN